MRLWKKRRSTQTKSKQNQTKIQDSNDNAPKAIEDDSWIIASWPPRDLWNRRNNGLVKLELTNVATDVPTNIIYIYTNDKLQKTTIKYLYILLFKKKKYHIRIKIQYGKHPKNIQIKIFPYLLKLSH